MAHKKPDETTKGTPPNEGAVDAPRPVCGIVMPISKMDGYTEDHWKDVRSILNAAIENAGFHPRMVSEADEIGIIQREIVQNLYANEIVVCDISGRNANVMFELGLRLAFDKATVLVKDDQTPYPFDTGQIQHVQYPRDLRHPLVEAFKTSLASKIKATHAAAANPEFSTFLKHFGQFTLAKLDNKEVTRDEFLVQEIRDMRIQMTNLLKRIADGPTRGYAAPEDMLIFDSKHALRQRNSALDVLTSYFSDKNPPQAVETEQMKTLLSRLQESRKKYPNDDAFRDQIRDILDTLTVATPSTKSKGSDQPA